MTPYLLTSIGSLRNIDDTSETSGTSPVSGSLWYVVP